MMNMNSAGQKQRRVQKHYRKAEQLRKAKSVAEQAENAAQATRTETLERENRSLRHRAMASPMPLPKDFYERMLRDASHQAARHLMQTVHDEMYDKPFFTAIGRVAEGIWNGALPMSVVDGPEPMVEATLMEAVWDDTYKFSVDIPAVRFDRIIDRRELRMMRDFGVTELVEPIPRNAKATDRVVMDTRDVRSYRSDI